MSGRLSLGWSASGRVLALVVAATVAASASVLAVWVQRQVLDTNVYVHTSSELPADPALHTVVASSAVDKVHRRVDVEAELMDVLPSDAGTSVLPASRLGQGAKPSPPSA